MEKFNLIIDAMKNGDFEKIDAFVHEDFMFFKEYEVQNREEWLEDIKKLIESDWEFDQPQLISENEDMVAMNHIVTEDTSIYRVTFVHFLKDGQTCAWQHTALSFPSLKHCLRAPIGQTYATLGCFGSTGQPSAPIVVS